jgi:hypothetical protein
MIMTGPVQWCLMLGPLAIYFAILAVWHGGRRPRIISGPRDTGLLAFGIGGLLIFGPLGQTLARALFGAPSRWDWLALIACLGLAAHRWARRARCRLVVYHIEPETLDRALGAVLDLPSGRFARTLAGFEDRAAARGVTIEASPRLRAAVIRAYGHQPEAFLDELKPRLRGRLESVTTQPSPVARVFVGLSAMTTLVVVATSLLVQPQARQVLRALLRRLHGV